jgi:hypothetical protein
MPIHGVGRRNRQVVAETQWLWPAQGDMLEFTTDSGGPIAAQVGLSIARRESPMRPAARLITPLWGSVYAEKLTSMT